MPCYDARGNETIREVIKHVDTPQTTEKLRMVLGRLNNATQLLCFMIGEAKNNGLFEGLPEDVKKWSESHDEQDEIRVREKLKEMVSKGEKSPFVLAKRLYDDAVKTHPVSNYHADWFYEMAKSVLQS